MYNITRVKTTLRLDDMVCFALYRALAKVQKAYAPLLEPLGLTYPQYIALVALWEEDGVSLSELGARLGLDSGTLTPLLKRMERDGLVRRERSQEDERRLVITLTAKGRKLESKSGPIAEQLLCVFDMTPAKAISLKNAISTSIRERKEDCK